MPSSILNSDDGVISGTSGLKTTGGDDGVLVFQSKGTETARINTDKQIVAAAGTASLPIYSTTGDVNTGIYFPAADNIGFATGGTIRGRWTTDGLCFGSDTAAANALDDYEEGDWTPAIEGSTTAGTASYSNNAGRYTKIGRQVFVEAYIDWFSGTGTGNLQIGNLPFTATNDNFFRPGISLGTLNNVALTANNVATGWINKNANFVSILQYPVGGGADSNVAYDGAGRIAFGAVYTI